MAIASKFAPGWFPAIASWWMAPTSCATARRSTSEPRPTATLPPRTPEPPRDPERPARSGIRTADQNNEPVAAVHFTARRDHPPDDCDHAVRPARIQVPAGRRFARSGLSDHPGTNVLPRRKSRRDDVFGDRAAG